MEQFLYYCAALVAVSGAIAVVVKVIKVLNEEHDNKQRYDKYEQDIRDVQSEQYMLTKSVLAILKGLEQLNCNGPVTEAHNELEAYLNEKAHKNT